MWSAQTASVFGSELASLAYPLTSKVVVLQATTFEVGLLQATGTASAALVGLFAGVVLTASAENRFLCGRFWEVRYLLFRFRSPPFLAF